MFCHRLTALLPFMFHLIYLHRKKHNNFHNTWHNWHRLTALLPFNNFYNTWHSTSAFYFLIVFMDLTIGWIFFFFFFSESNCLSKLGKLTHLNLRSNSFDKEILRFLSALPALKSLDLSSNDYMEGPLSSNGTSIFKFSLPKLNFYNQFYLCRHFYFLHVKKYQELHIDSFERKISICNCISLENNTCTLLFI